VLEGIRKTVAGMALGLTLAAAGGARAADEEIQVYMDEMNARGAFGLDLHLNDVASGDAVPDAPGGQIALHRFRLTPEWSYGLTKDLELGLYLPLATVEGNGRVQAAGIKGRVKFIAPKAEGQDWWAGLNFEIGRVNHTLDVNPWNAELKGIWGMRKGRWTLGLNANLDFAVAGPDKGPATLEIATKLGWRVRPGLDVGIESYNGVGEITSLGRRLSRQDQATYAVIDKSLGKWDLNFGVGHGYGGASDGWVLKAVVGVPIG
jgi:hypothetical protein